MQDAGPEGGEYEFIFGETEMSADRMEFDLFLETNDLKPPLDKIRAYFLADVMAARTKSDSPFYFSPWAAAVKSISLLGPQQVRSGAARRGYPR